MDELSVISARMEVRVEEHERRINKLEKSVHEIQELTLSVSKLASNMEQMLEEQKRQRTDIDQLKSEPSDRWNSMKRTAFTSIISTIAGALAIGLVMLIAQYIR